MNIKPILPGALVFIAAVPLTYAQEKSADSVKTLQSVEVLGRTQKSFRNDYSFFGTKTETPVINMPQSISVVTKELISEGYLVFDEGSNETHRAPFSHGQLRGQRTRMICTFT